MKRFYIIWLLCSYQLLAGTITDRTKTTTAGGDSTMFIVDRGDGGIIATCRWHWLDMMTQAAGNGLTRSGNTLAINPGAGLYLGTDAIHVWPDTAYSTHIIDNKVGVVLYSAGGLAHTAVGLKINLGSGSGLTVDGNILEVYPDETKGLAISDSKLTVKADSDSAIGFTAAGKIYTKIDKDKGLEYSSGKIGVALDAAGNLRFQIDGDLVVDPYIEIGGDSLYIKFNGGDWKAIRIYSSEGPL